MTYEGAESSLGLLSLFSKSASTLKKSAHKQFQRVSQLRGSFGASTGGSGGGGGAKDKPKALLEVLRVHTYMYVDIISVYLHVLCAAR